MDLEPNFALKGKPKQSNKYKVKQHWKKKNKGEGEGEKKGKKSPFMFGGEGKCEKDGIHYFIPLLVKKIQTTNNKQDTHQTSQIHP